MSCTWLSTKVSELISTENRERKLKPSRKPEKTWASHQKLFPAIELESWVWAELDTKPAEPEMGILSRENTSEYG